MSTKLLIVVIAIIVAIGGGYLYLNKSNNLYNTNNTPTPESSESTDEASQISPTGTSIVINEQNASGESGIATISELNGKVVVNLKLTGFIVQTPQPVHFHSGTCEAPGKVIYPLINVVNGESKTTLDINMTTFNSALPLILNVHKSEVEVDFYTACGQVSP